MMKPIQKILPLFLCLSFSAISGPAVKTKIEIVGINSNGTVFFNVEALVEEPNCPGKQVLVPPDSEIKDKVLSIALAAKASNADVIVKTSGCYGKSPAIIKSAADTGWLYISN